MFSDPKGRPTHTGIEYECGDLNTLTRGGGDLLFLSMLESYGFPELLDLISYKYVPWK